MKKRTIRNTVKVILFLTIVAVLLVIISNVCIPDLLLKQQNLLYEEEPEDSIDIAFVGSSATYKFYDVMTIWNEYEVTSMCYFNDAMPYDFVIPLLEFIQERQDPEVYVIDLRHIITDEYKLQYLGEYETDTQKAAFVDALNLLPNSWSKWELIADSVYTEDEIYMYALSILFNHEAFVDGIGDLIQNNFNIEALDYKGNKLVYSVNDLTDTYVDFDEIEEDETYTLTEDTTARLIELLEYCDENKINAFFTITPYVHSKGVVDEDIRREFGEVIAEYGYPYVDYRDQIEEIGLDFTTDFYDKTHANASGATKYTLYAMEDILEAYEFETDYEQDIIDSWNQEYEEWVVYDEQQRADNFE